MEIAPRIGKSGWGTIGAWAWGTSRIVDYLENNRRFDSKRLTVTGVSRAGKTALWCDAQDERISAVIATVSGCGGGGFDGPAPEEELLLRWIQNGIFQPRFCINSANSDNSVTQPFMYEDVNPEICNAYALRYRMLPYLYSLMWEAHQNGLPVIRPLFLEFPKDKNTYYDRSMAFMFGPAVLVANVLEKGAEYRTVYLPAGVCWYDFHDKMKRYEGGQTVRLPVDLNSIPMLLRGGSIYYESDDIRHISSDVLKHLRFYITPDCDAEFTFYDDAGYTNQFEQEQYSETKITVSSGEQVKVHFYKEGKYRNTWKQAELIVINKEKGAFGVRVDGKVLPQYLTREDYENAPEAWYYNMSDRTVRVSFHKPERMGFNVIISFERFDLIGMNHNG